MSATYKTNEVYATDTIPQFIAPKNSTFVNPSVYVNYSSLHILPSGATSGFIRVVKFATPMKSIMGFSLLHASFPQPANIALADAQIIVRVRLLPNHTCARVMNALPDNNAIQADPVTDSTFVILNEPFGAIAPANTERTYHKYGDVPQSHFFTQPQYGSGFEFEYFNSRGQALQYQNEQVAPHINMLFEVWGSVGT